MAQRSVNETTEARNTRKKRRFVRWQRTLPKHTRYLTELVAERLLPQFESRGFIWHDKATAGYLYLVKPGSSCWPAVQMWFEKRARPMLLITVACLPEICRAWDGKKFVPVGREDAHIVDAHATFYLRNHRKLAPNYFGYHSFSLIPSRKLRNEIATVESLLPHLFKAFDDEQLLDRQRWPEMQDWLGLSFDRTGFFDPDELPHTLRPDQSTGQ